MKDILSKVMKTSMIFSHALQELELRETPNGHPLRLIHRPGSLKICHGPLETIIYYQEKRICFGH